MSVIERNRTRWRAVQISRAWRELLQRGRASLLWLAMCWLLPARAYRRVFASDGARLRTAAQFVLADLRDFSFADRSAFDPDPLVMARRQGRRDVWLRISNYLLLDEEQVNRLMEVDDGV
jgi:hypothetical protein